MRTRIIFIVDQAITKHLKSRIITGLAFFMMQYAWNANVPCKTFSLWKNIMYLVNYNLHVSLMSSACFLKISFSRDASCVLLLYTCKYQNESRLRGKEFYTVFILQPDIFMLQQFFYFSHT